MPELAQTDIEPRRTRKLGPGAIPFSKNDRERARLAGIRSGEVRRNRSIARFYRDKEPGEDLVRLQLNEQLDLVKEQIQCTRDLLNDRRHAFCEECKRGGIEPHHRAQLLRALDSLLDRQRELLGVPRAGSRRPPPERRADHSRPGAVAPRLASAAAPVAAMPAAEPAPPQPPTAAADTPTNGVPPPNPA